LLAKIESDRYDERKKAELDDESEKKTLIEQLKKDLVITCLSVLLRAAALFCRFSQKS
jgi:hypothetical protein